MTPSVIDLLAIGEILVDLISTEPADSLQQARAFAPHQGGSPANLAVNVARLGCRAALAAKAGDDAFGQFLQQAVTRSGVITDYLHLDPTVQTSLVFVAQTTGTPDFLPYRSADYQLTPSDIPAEAIERSRLVHTTTWPLSRQPSRDTVLQAVKQARALGKPVSFDPNYHPLVWPDAAEAQQVMRALFEHVTITKASLVDSERFFGSGKSPEEYIQLFHDLGPETVVFTLGKDGSMLSHRGVLLGRLPARPVQVKDATGAGDAFWAGFLTALLDGNSLERCLLFARAVVELKLQTIGPLPDALERQAIYARLPEPGQAFLLK
jgi:fructokinase